MKNWIKIGEFSVDAGLCWIGDPCYIKKNFFLPWAKFCDKLSHDGLVDEFPEGLCLPSGCGDGVYEVYAQYHRDGTIEKVLIDFTGEMAEDA